MKLWILLVLLSGPAMAGDPSLLSHDELCVWRATGLIAPSEMPEGAAAVVAAELAKRGELCNDPSYVQIAEARLQAAERYASEQAQTEQPSRRNWADRIGAAGRAYLQAQPPRPAATRPTTTTCHQFGETVTCTTN